MTKPRTTPIDPLAELLATPVRVVRGKPCSVHEWAMAHPEWADSLATALESTQHSFTEISARLDGALSDNTLGHHARGTCSCWRVPGRWARGRRAA